MLLIKRQGKLIQFIFLLTLEVERKKRTFGFPNQVQSIEQTLPASSLGNYVGKSGYLKRFS